MRLKAALAAAVLAGPAAAAPLPIIDMHQHAHTLEDYGGGAQVCFNDKPMSFPGVVAPQAITIEAVMSCARPVAPAASKGAVPSRQQKRDILYENAARFLRLP